MRELFEIQVVPILMDSAKLGIMVHCLVKAEPLGALCHHSQTRIPSYHTHPQQTFRNAVLPIDAIRICPAFETAFWQA